MPDATPPPSPGRRLEYDRSDGPFATRRGMRLLIGFTLLNTALLLALLLGVQPGPLVRAQWQKWQAAREAARAERKQLALQRQCLDYSMPAERVVYEEDPAEIAKLLAAGNGAYGVAFGRRNMPPGAPAGWQPPVRANDPDFVAGFSQTSGQPESGRASCRERVSDTV